ncbi:MAG: hypothetical protein RXR10_05975 [Vulcanisaeta sp.]
MNLSETLLLIWFVLFIVLAIMVETTLSEDGLMYIYSPNVYVYGMSITNGTYNGEPVVIMTAQTLSMSFGEVVVGMGVNYNVTIGMASATMYSITIYAANITVTAPLIGTITITPQNARSITSELASLLSEFVPLPLTNVKIYAYYVNASTISYKGINATIS